MRNLLKCILALSLVGTVGCTGLESVETTESALDKVNRGKSLKSNVPECLVKYEEYQLDANLVAFEIYSKKGFEFGFNLMSGLFRMLGINFRTEKGIMTMYMGLSQSIDPTNWVAYVEGQATAKKREFRFDIGLEQMGAGLSYFKQTPMSNLTGKTVKNGLHNLQQEVDRKVVRWKTRIVHTDAEEESVVIPVGEVSGLMPGDMFNIYNVNYIWKDQPCESELLIPQKTTFEALAVGQAVQVEDNATVLRILEKNYEDPIELGAMVEVNMLTGDNRYLFRQVRIRDVSSEPIVIDGHSNLNLEVYLDQQVRAFMDLYGFQPRN